MWLLIARYWKHIAAALAVIALVTTVALHFRADGRTRAALAKLQDEAQTVVLATQAASGNDTVKWDTVPGQIVALGDSNRRLKDSIAVQNQAIDDMAAEAVRLKAKASEMQAIADKARAQRESALRRLSDLSLTPGTRNDCLQLLAEANNAIDLAYSALKERSQ